MNLIEKYNKQLQAIYTHVGFEEDWVVYPIDDSTGYFWRLDLVNERVNFADSIEELESEIDNYYSEPIYTQRFYDKHVYQGTDFTMIFCDSQVDGMKWFRIFDNKKQIKQ